MDAQQITIKIMSMYNVQTQDVDALIDQYYDENAVFTDPLVEVHGRENVAAQFRFLPVIFGSSEAKILRGSLSGESMLSIESVVSGRFRFLPMFFGCSFRMFTVLEFRGNKIVRHTDHWDLRSVVENFPLFSVLYPKVRYVLGQSSSMLINSLSPAKAALPRELLTMEESKTAD